MSKLPSPSRRLVMSTGLAGLSVALAGCGGGGISGLPLFGSDSGGGQPQPSAPPPTQPGTPVSGQVIGQGQVRAALIVPLTGQGATFGNAMRNAAELALSQFPNPNLQILVKDDRASPDGAREAAQSAIAEGAELIIGPLFAPNVQAAAQVARAANRPIIAFSTDQSVAARGVYLLSFLVEIEVERIISFAAQQGRRSCAALIPDSAYGKVAEAAFQQTAAARGMRVVAIERYPANQAGITAAAAKLAPALAQADCLFLPDNAGSLPAVTQALTGAGFSPQRVKPLGTGVWNEASVFRLPGLQGGWFAAPDGAGFNAFAQRYKAKFNADPTRNATLAYDAVSLAAALVQSYGAQRFAENVLTGPDGFAGADGIFRFRADGLSERGLAVIEIRNGAPVTVQAPPKEFPKGAARG